MIRHPIGKELAALPGLAQLLAFHGMLHVGHRAACIPGDVVAVDVDVVIEAVWLGDIGYGCSKSVLYLFA